MNDDSGIVNLKKIPLYQRGELLSRFIIDFAIADTETLFQELKKNRGIKK